MPPEYFVMVVSHVDKSGMIANAHVIGPCNAITAHGKAAVQFREDHELDETAVINTKLLFRSEDKAEADTYLIDMVSNLKEKSNGE